jgi:hypothetical protein
MAAARGIGMKAAQSPLREDLAAGDVSHEH